MPITKVFSIEDDKFTPVYKKNPENENELELHRNSNLNRFQSIELDDNKEAKNTQDNESKTKKEGYRFWPANVYMWFILALVVIITIVLSIVFAFWIKGKYID